MSNDLTRIEFCCLGGPWDRQVLRLGSAGTLPFTVLLPSAAPTGARTLTVWAGRYAPAAHRLDRVALAPGAKKYPIVEWVPAPICSDRGWFQ